MTKHSPLMTAILQVGESGEGVAVAGDEATLAMPDKRESTKPVVLHFFFGVRRYVALACRASYEDARSCRRGHIIPSESFGLGKSGIA